MALSLRTALASCVATLALFSGGCGCAADDVQPVYDVLARTLGNTSESAVCRPVSGSCPRKGCLICFDLTLDANMAQGFALSSGNVKPITVAVKASSLPELSYGAAYYLRTAANMSFSWVRTGGNQVAMPAGGFQPVAKPLTVKKRVKWSYYQNVCTQSYSMWWWE